jgi:WD40 repeat protein
LNRIDRRDRVAGGAIIPASARHAIALVRGDRDPDDPDRGRFAASDVITREERGRFPASDDSFTDFDISADGRTLAALWVRTLVAHETATDRVRYRLDGGGWPPPSLTAFAFAPDGAAIATMPSDGSIRRRDPATGRERRRFAGHRPRTASAAFAPDDRIMANSGSQGPALLWDVATGRILARLEGRRRSVLAPEFSPDARCLATGGEDTTVLTWDVGASRAGEPSPRGGRRAAGGHGSPALAPGRPT